MAYLEPKPIPSPDDRIETIKKLKEIGATTVVALRPFLPVVDVNDYLIILEKLNGYVDIALGEAFYFKRNGDIFKRVFPNGIPLKCEKDITNNNKMPFDYNNENWDIWDSSNYEEVVRKYCKKNNIVFSMHSEESIIKIEKQLEK